MLISRTNFLIVIYTLMIFGVGISTGGRYLIDELAAIVIFLVTIAYVIKSKSKSIFLGIELHWRGKNVLLLIFLLYQSAQAVRILALEPTSSGFVYMIHCLLILFAVLVFAAYMVRLNSDEIATFKRAALWAIVAYNFCYLAQGFVYENFLFEASDSLVPGRYATQGVFWSGSAYAAFPSLIALFILSQEENAVSIALVALATSIALIALYYSSRLALGSFAACLTIGFCNHNSRPLYKLIFILVCVLASIFLFNTFRPFYNVMSGAMIGVKVLISPYIGSDITAGDYDRYAHFYGAFRAISSNAWTMIFGHGYMEHRQVIGSYIVDIYLEQAACAEDRAVCQKVLNLDQPGTEKRTTSFSAIVVDSGWLGITLFYASIGYAWFVSAAKLGWQGALILRHVSLALPFGLLAIWPIFIYLHDILLFWIVLLPIFCDQKNRNSKNLHLT